MLSIHLQTHRATQHTKDTEEAMQQSIRETILNAFLQTVLHNFAQACSQAARYDIQ